MVDHLTSDGFFTTFSMIFSLLVGVVTNKYEAFLLVLLWTSVSLAYVLVRLAIRLQEASMPAMVWLLTMAFWYVDPVPQIYITRIGVQRAWHHPWLGWCGTQT